MDVTCERCQTEYEFDETLISDRGTTVKCTHCGHLFKIFRKGSGAERLPGAAGRVWTLRRTTGETLTFDRLTTLQQWIIEGRVDKADEISRTGEVWKALGAIAELATFFAAAEAATKAAAPSVSTARRPRTPPMGMRAPSSEEYDTLEIAPTQPVSRDPTKRGLAAGGQAGPPAAPAPRGAKSTMLGLAPGIAGSPAPFGGAKAPQARFDGKPPPTPPAAATARADVLGPTVPIHGPGPTPRAAAPLVPPPPPPAPPPARHESPRAPAGAPPPPAPRPPPTREMAPDLEERATLDDSAVASVRESFDHAGIPPAVAVVEPGGELGAIRPSIAPQPAWASEDIGSPSEADDVPLPRRRSRIGIAIVIVLLVAMGGVVLALAGGSIGRFFGGAFAPTPEPRTEVDRGAELVARARESLLADTDADLEAAMSTFQQALGVRQNDARALAGLGEALAIQAQYARDRAVDLDEKARRIHVPNDSGAQALAAQVELRAQAKLLHDSEQGLVARARRYGDDAVKADPNLAEARRALAEALRLGGDLPGARTELARALGSGATSAENRYANAMISLETPEARPQARAELMAAIAASPRMVRAILRLARLDAIEGEVARSRSGAQEILRLHPDHPRAKSLVAALDASDPPVTPVVIASDQGGGAPSPPGPGPDAQQPTGPSPPDHGTRQEGPAPGRSADSYVAEGERLQRGGQAAQARRAFEMALQVQPSRSEALAGLGFVLLQMGDAQGAMTQFRRLINVNPSYAAAYFGLGQAAQRAGQTGLAAQNYRRFLEFPTASGARADTARRFLDSLGGGSGDDQGGPPPGPEGPGPDEAPLPPDTGGSLPAPIGTQPGTDVPQSDAPAVDSEPPGLPPITEP
ncbi:MAG: zinc-ribbon domain-containing protein [Deltaproteobacteria bacterium]|nr:zinc-ribbon domain-containing protein [Deltaproteobacteria bacterium]